MNAPARRTAAAADRAAGTPLPAPPPATGGGALTRNAGQPRGRADGGRADGGQVGGGVARDGRALTRNAGQPRGQAGGGRADGGRAGGGRADGGRADSGQPARRASAPAAWLAVRRLLARLAVILAGLATLLGLTSAPAWAHAGGLNPTDARSIVTGLTPRQPGVTAVTVNNGTQVEVRVPGRPVARAAVPVVRVSANTRARTWQVPVRTSAGTFVVLGRTEYVPGPSPWPWAGLMLALAVPGYLLARSRWWRAGLAACIVAATAANLIHAVGSAMAVSGQPFFWLFVGASGVGLVTWPLAVAAVVAAAMRRQFVAFAATLIGAMLVVAGFPDVDSFRRSQLPFAWPPDLDRLLVAITLGVGAGLAIGGIAALHRHLVTDSPSEPATDPSIRPELDPDEPSAPSVAAREPHPASDPSPRPELDPDEPSAPSVAAREPRPATDPSPRPVRPPHPDAGST